MTYPAEFEDIYQTASNTSDSLIKMLRDKKITPGEWFERMMVLIERAYNLAAGVGSGLDELSPEIKAVIDSQVLAQEAFLRNFLSDIESGEWDDRYISRARMYVASSYSGYSHGDIVKQAGKVLPVPAYPTEGTQCLSNCKCFWDIDTLDFERGNFDAYWKLGTDDNCQTCQVRAAEWSPVRIRAGVLI